jgi:succinate dehydrogenase / fumarate reductase cytochrome b subunit
MPSAAAKKHRPKFLSLPAILFQIRLPLPGWVSILHRVSGALLFFPFAAWLLYLLDASLASEQGFSRIKDHYLQLPVMKAAVLLFIWSLCHHFCAGIRFLLIDVHVGVDLPATRYTSVAVIAGGLLLTAFFGARLW